ncbi:MAG TPA: PilZ domain-containing protein [Candidatus Acidoferrum sp.]|nr:PilZ domain-containing protein [Candidatus Acidoferrum sp.]
MSPKDILIDAFQGVRRAARVHCVREISLSREGHDELIRIKAPDLSSTGMFITAVGSFPEGTVLNLKFRLAATGVEVRTRCEVRYCLPGVGIGVEFVGLSSEAAEDIENELALNGEAPERNKKNRPASRSSRRR